MNTIIGITEQIGGKSVRNIHTKIVPEVYISNRRKSIIMGRKYKGHKQ